MADLGLRRHVTALADGRFLRLVNYHNTPASRTGTLRRELADVAARYDVVGLAEVDAFFDTGRWPGRRDPVALVFYEGYRNSATVAAPLLDELGLTGWFPVCTDWVACPADQQEVFARSHWIQLLPEELEQDRLAMTWDDVGRLGERHVVTPHTATHASLADVATDDDAERELVRPKDLLEARTGRPAPATAWLFGTSWGVSGWHDAAVRAAGYRYLIGNSLLHRIA